MGLGNNRKTVRDNNGPNRPFTTATTTATTTSATVPTATSVAVRAAIRAVHRCPRRCFWRQRLQPRRSAGGSPGGRILAVAVAAAARGAARVLILVLVLAWLGCPTAAAVVEMRAGTVWQFFWTTVTLLKKPFRLKLCVETRHSDSYSKIITRI